MMKIVISWVLFSIGHVTDKCISNHDNVINDRLAYVYQWCMTKSFELQEKSSYGRHGPWDEV